MELADVGQRLGEDFGFVAGGDVGESGHGCQRPSYRAGANEIWKRPLMSAALLLG